MYFTHVCIQDPIVISEISVTVKSYSVDYFNPMTGDSCGPMVVLNLTSESRSCTSNELCKVRGDLIVPESCGNGDIDVTVSATSLLGIGPIQRLRIG